jgi:hypothetical protein
MAIALIENVNCFTPTQMEQIKSLNVKCAHSTGGYNGDLHWGWLDGKMHAYLYYQARDSDGDWGTAVSYKDDLTFKELIEVIKNPQSKFDTRSWN